MTHAMHAIGWLELGREIEADKEFKKNFDNIVGPFKVWLTSQGVSNISVKKIKDYQLFKGVIVRTSKPCNLSRNTLVLQVAKEQQR